MNVLPSICRAVVCLYGDDGYPAIVIAAEGTVCDLRVFRRNGDVTHLSVRHRDDPAADSRGLRWAWPTELVPDRAALPGLPPAAWPDASRPLPLPLPPPPPAGEEPPGK